MFLNTIGTRKTIKYFIFDKIELVLLMIMLISCKTFYNRSSNKTIVQKETVTSTRSEEVSTQLSASENITNNATYNNKLYVFSLQHLGMFANKQNIFNIKKLEKKLQKKLQIELKKSSSQIKDINILLYMGFIYLIENDFDKAYKYAQLVLRFDLDNVAAKKLMAAALLGEGKLELCELIINKLFETQKEDDDLYLLTGLLNITKNSLDDAIVNFKKAVEINRLNVGANLNLVILYLQNNDFNKITPYVENLKQVNVNAYEIKVFLAIQNALSKNYIQAESLYQELLQHIPSWYWLRYNLALTQYELNKLDLALKNIKIFLNSKNIAYEYKIDAQKLLEQIQKQKGEEPKSANTNLDKKDKSESIKRGEQPK